MDKNGVFAGGNCSNDGRPSLISEELANGKMADAERILEDK